MCLFGLTENIFPEVYRLSYDLIRPVGLFKFASQLDTAVLEPQTEERLELTAILDHLF